MVKSIPAENELYSLQIKIKKNDIHKKIIQNKQTIFIKMSLNNLIKLFYKSKQNFYNWAKKIQLCLKEKLNFIVLAKKSTRPININNNYSKTYKIAVAKMMKNIDKNMELVFMSFII